MHLQSIPLVEEAVDSAEGMTRGGKVQIGLHGGKPWTIPGQRAVEALGNRSCSCQILAGWG